MSKIKVSIVVPVYNTEKYLGQCLNSLINQTLREIEIICVNDGSTDNSYQILDEYSKKDPRIKIINQENNGCGASRKIGLNNANGDYIAFVDSDDWVKLDTYEKLYKNGVSNNSDLVIFNATRYDENSDKYMYMGGFDIGNYLNNDSIDFNYFTFNYKDIKPFVLNSSFSAWAKLYKSEFLNGYEDFYFPEKISYEDVPFHVQVLLRAKNISFCKDELYIYRVSNFNSIINTTSADKRVFDIFIVVDKVEQFLIENNKMNEFEFEIGLFVIRQLTQWLDKCDNSYNQEFFERTKQQLKNINIKNDDYSQLNLKYRNIIASDSYKEFKLLEEIQSLKSMHSNQIKKLTKNYEDKINTQKQTNEQKLINQKKVYEEKLNYQEHVSEKRIENKEQLIEKMNSSNSWKLTIPLRKLGKLLKK